MSDVEIGALEPSGGNLYRPHSLMITSGQFWRCAHGSTGFGAEMVWAGCLRCAEGDPEAFKKWHNTEALARIKQLEQERYAALSERRGIEETTRITCEALIEERNAAEAERKEVSGER